MNEVKINASLLETVLLKAPKSVVYSDKHTGGNAEKGTQSRNGYDLWLRVQFAATSKSIVVYDVQKNSVRRIETKDYDEESMILGGRVFVLAVGNIRVKDAGVIEYEQAASKRMDTLIVFAHADSKLTVHREQRVKGEFTYPVIAEDDTLLPMAKLTKAWLSLISFMNGDTATYRDDWKRFAGIRQIREEMGVVSKDDEDFYYRAKHTIDHVLRKEDDKKRNNPNSNYRVKNLRF